MYRDSCHTDTVDPAWNARHALLGELVECYLQSAFPDLLVGSLHRPRGLLCYSFTIASLVLVLAFSYKTKVLAKHWNELHPYGMWDFRLAAKKYVISMIMLCSCNRP